MTDYESYLDAQRMKTIAWDANPASRGPLRVNYLSWQLHRLVPDLQGEALCVGCRNVYELDAFRRLGLTVTGIDLVSLHPDVQIMDMHALRFPDHTFDILVASHVLEHAYRLNKALAECYRVTKPGGIWVIEMPVQFTPTAVDRHDVVSLKALWRLLKPYLQKPLWAQAPPQVVRLIARTRG